MHRKHSLCKALRALLPALLLLMHSVTAQAQSVRDEEESSFILCRNGKSDMVEAKACVDWISASMKRMTYSDRIHDIEVMFSDDDMLKFRTEADKILEDDVEPIMAVRLNFDILNRLTSSDERLKRLDRLVYWAKKLAPNQRQTVISDIVLLNDFPAFAKSSNGKKFIEQCRDETQVLLPDISEDTSTFLRNLQQNAPEFMTKEASLVMLIQEIRVQQYQTAHIHLAELEARINDWNKLPESLRNALFSAISNNALSFMGFAELDKTACLPEFAKRRQSSHIDLLDRIVAGEQYKNRSILLTHIIAGKIGLCDYEGAAQSLFSTFNSIPRDADVAETLGKLLTFAEKSRSERLIASMMSAIAPLSQPALSALKTHSTRLTRLAIEACANAIDRNDIERAKMLASGMSAIAPESLRTDVNLMLGRVQSLLKNNALARQYWSQVIEENHSGARAEQAFYLSIQTLIADGKKAEAESLKAQFREYIPLSQYLQMLP